MSILVRPVSDADLDQACIIEDAASADIDINLILFPGPSPPGSQRKRVDSLIQLRKDDPTVVYLQAIDTASGRMVAFARFHIYKTPEETQVPIRKLKSELETNQKIRNLESDPGTNAEACKVFLLIECLRGNRRWWELDRISVWRRPDSVCTSTDEGIDLHMLHTDPEYQGRGAGSVLMEQIKQSSYELGLPIYLETSTKAHRLYLKHGFKDLEVVEIDFRPLGGPIYKQPLMMLEVSESR
ncbi:acyl-CoA N-acyltransferase [Aaosphaeria arxii CBS 175.79]|uniref:Acyl-CoA N-acyltransferase n=1 Tax=Aaosphaeria arxii CBS 175.79 TaxID=1450172 RepID=A0A6A5Y4F0_9PLEO|nr:acyl-CoA N-acyltransferase [Aaosphaeria arxii CBS 175.79]KAF2020149.1 acyl-CoA N-acyltransferase [Aaosphaeria arxii CBS 175.79]